MQLEASDEEGDANGGGEGDEGDEGRGEHFGHETQPSRRELQLGVEEQAQGEQEEGVLGEEGAAPLHQFGDGDGIEVDVDVHHLSGDGGDGDGGEGEGEAAVRKSGDEGEDDAAGEEARRQEGVAKRGEGHGICCEGPGGGKRQTTRSTTRGAEDGRASRGGRGAMRR